MKLSQSLTTTLLTAALILTPSQVSEAAPDLRPVASKTEPTKVPRTPMAARSHAKMVTREYWGSGRQYACLDRLWTAESNWRPNAYNPRKVGGKNAGGIPQLLGLNPKTSVEHQVKRGLRYIRSRYGTPCAAWQHHQRHGWY